MDDQDGASLLSIRQSVITCRKGRKPQLSGSPGSYAQAQVLLQQGHSYLDGDGDGEACEGLRG